MTYNPADDRASSLRPSIDRPRMPGDRIDRAQETYEPSPHASRRIPPSGQVSRDGKRIYAEPGLASRILVWGGLVAGAAAATAGTVLAIRTVVDGIAGSDEDDAVEAARQRARARARKGVPPKLPRNSHAGPRRRRPQAERNLAPRFAAMDEDEREAVRSRDHDLREEDRRRIQRQRDAARSRAASRQPTGSQHGFLDGVNASISDITRSVEAAIGTVTAAIEGFKGVSGQAGSIVQDFRNAADSVKSMLDIAPGSSAREPRHARDGQGFNASTGRPHASQPPAGDDIVDLRDTASADRTHKL